MRTGVLVALLVALISGAAFGAKFTFKPSANDVQIARTLHRGRQEAIASQGTRGTTVPPIQPWTIQLRGGGQRQIMPGIIVTSKKVGNATVIRTDNVMVEGARATWQRIPAK